MHCDANYRGVINMLVMCGCVSQSGGGWAHYVGREKLRPQAGWAPVAFAPFGGVARHGSRTERRSSTRTLISGATRRSIRTSSRRQRRPSRGTGALIDTTSVPNAWLAAVAPQLKSIAVDRGEALISTARLEPKGLRRQGLTSGGG